MNGLSRRRLLKGSLYGAGATVLAPALGACGSVTGSVSDADEVQFWNLFQGPDGALMKDITRDIERRTPGLKVRSTVLEWGAPYYTKLAMASMRRALAGPRDPASDAAARLCARRAARSLRHGSAGRVRCAP